MTELVDCAPEEIGIAPDLLGHSDLQTTKRHYIQAVGMQAHAKSSGDDRCPASRGDIPGQHRDIRYLTREWPV